MNKKVVIVLAALAGIFYTPYGVSYILSGGSFPRGMPGFPPVTAPAKAGFNVVIFVIIALLFAAVLLLFFFPRFFTFKAIIVPDKNNRPRTRLPFWFWIGLPAWGIPLAILIMHAQAPKWLVNWAELPIFWGFTLLLDGWVYVRNHGHSIIHDSLRELLAIGMVSISGWLIFEYLNFFVKINWYYPKSGLIAHDEFLLYAVAGSSGLMPMAFEWYHLLLTSRFFKNRYRYGPAVSASPELKNMLLLVSFIGLMAAPVWPDKLFFILWLAPMIILTVLLEKAGIWTPFTPVKKGDWSALVLFSFTYLVQGFLLECWNYLSASHDGGNMITHNPAYWAYSIPYVEVLHVFEMPLLGYLGYVPFGVYCWIWWIALAFLLDIRTGYTFQDHLR